MKLWILFVCTTTTLATDRL